MSTAEPPPKRRRIEVPVAVLEAIQDADLRAEVEKLAGNVLQRLDRHDPETVMKYLEAGAGALPPPEEGPIAESTGRLTSTGRIAGFPRAEINRILDEHTKDLKTAGTTFAGKWTDVGYVSGPAPKNPVRDLQLGNQLAQTLINAIQGKTTEIEVMIVNDRIVVSANEASTVEELSGKTLADLIGSAVEKGDATKLEDFQIRKTDKFAALFDALRGGENPNRTGTHRLAELVVDCEIWEEQAASVKSVLTTLQQAHTTTAGIEAHDAEKVGALIEDPAYAGRIIAVKAQEGNGKPIAHAEQNLLLALARSTYRGPVAISGGKRPCTMCAWSLDLVRTRGARQLRFNPHPGGYWAGTTGAGLYNLCTALRLDKADFKVAFEAMTKEAITQYVSDFDAGADWQTKLDRLVEAVQHKEVRTDAPTPSDSPSRAGESWSRGSSRSELTEIDWHTLDRELHGEASGAEVSWDESSAELEGPARDVSPERGPARRGEEEERPAGEGVEPEERVRRERREK